MDRAQQPVGAGRFSFRSDRLCLDFAATQMFRETDDPRDLLDSPVELGTWVLASGTVSDPIAGDSAALSDAVVLREAIYRLAVARIRGHRPQPDDRAVLNRHGRVAPVALTLGATGAVTRAGSVASVLATIARDAIELLGGPEAGRLRQCGRGGCTRMFIDRSRGGNRAWCGMRECGNRVNAAAYRRRQRHQGAQPT